MNSRKSNIVPTRSEKPSNKPKLERKKIDIEIEQGFISYAQDTTDRIGPILHHAIDNIMGKIKPNQIIMRHVAYRVKTAKTHRKRQHTQDVQNSN